MHHPNRTGPRVLAMGLAAVVPLSAGVVTCSLIPGCGNCQPVSPTAGLIPACGNCQPASIVALTNAGPAR